MAMQALNAGYRPHRFQLMFHQSTKRFRVMVAGVRGGKTAGGANEAVKMALCGSPGHGVSAPNFGWVIGATYNMLRVAIREFFRWLPPEISQKSEWRRAERTLYLPNGSVVEFRSAEDPESLRGPGLNWIWIDEGSTVSQAAWDVLLTRVTDTQGIIWVTTTPKGFNWVYSELYQHWLEGDPDIECIHFLTTDNPMIQASEVERMRRRMLPEFFRQEYEASFESMSGMVYKNWNPRIHVINDAPIPLNSEVFGAIDFGFTNPFVHLWVAVTPARDLIVFDEYYRAGEVLERHANEIIDRGIPVCIYADPSSPQNILDLSNRGLPVVPANNDIIAGINRVSELLAVVENKPHPYLNDVQNSPSLFVMKKCVNLIKEFAEYQWAENRSSLLDRERPVKRKDHALDAARYLCLTYFGDEEFSGQLAEVWQESRLERDSERSSTPEIVFNRRAFEAAGLDSVEEEVAKSRFDFIRTGNY